MNEFDILIRDFICYSQDYLRIKTAREEMLRYPGPLGKEIVVTILNTLAEKQGNYENKIIEYASKLAELKNADT